MGTSGRLLEILLRMLRFIVITKYKIDKLFEEADPIKVVLFAIVLIMVLAIGHGRIY